MAEIVAVSFPIAGKVVTKLLCIELEKCEGFQGCDLRHSKLGRWRDILEFGLVIGHSHDLTVSDLVVVV